MAAHSITFSTTAGQEARLQKAFERANRKKLSSAGLGQPVPESWPDIDSWLKDFLFDHVRQFVKDEEAFAEVSRKEAYASASQGVKDQVDALLGIAE